MIFDNFPTAHFLVGGFVPPLLRDHSWGSDDCVMQYCVVSVCDL